MGIALVLGIAFFFKLGEEITFSKPVLECEYNKTRWECGVSFTLTNHSVGLKSGRLSIRGMGFKTQSRSPQTVLSEDKFIEFEVGGHDTITINEVIFSERKPKLVSIKIIEKHYVD